MGNRLEYRGKWSDIFWQVILLVLASIFTLGLAVPWAFVAYRRKVLSFTFYQGAPLYYDGEGGEYFGQIMLGLLLTLVTLGFYLSLGFYQARLLKYDVSHTILPGGQRMVFTGTGLDLFGQYLLIAVLSGLTLGIYGFWGYARMRRFILQHTFVEGRPLNFSGTGGQYLGISLIIALLSAITLGIYSFLGMSTTRMLRWDAQNTIIPDFVIPPLPYQTS